MREFVDETAVQQHPLMAYKATADPDTLYYHEAAKADDFTDFQKAMIKEVDHHFDSGNCELVPRSQVPKGVMIHPSVWALKRKRKIDTQEVYKHKARLNFDGSTQVKGETYWESFAPVASWATIRLLLILTLRHSYETLQVDYVAAYTQAPNELEHAYMELPKGFKGPASGVRYVLRLLKNWYGQRQASTVWNKYLVAKLKEIGFEQSNIDDCLFYRGDVLMVLYTDDSILVGPNKQELLDITEQ